MSKIFASSPWTPFEGRQRVSSYRIARDKNKAIDCYIVINKDFLQNIWKNVAKMDQQHVDNGQSPKCIKRINASFVFILKHYNLFLVYITYKIILSSLDFSLKRPEKKLIVGKTNYNK